jgi:hypothetical protein
VRSRAVYRKVRADPKWMWHAAHAQRYVMNIVRLKTRIYSKVKQES